MSATEQSIQHQSQRRPTMAQTKHVVAITFPFGSHPPQILNFIRSLAAASAHTTFSFLGTAKSNTSLFGPSKACDGFDNIIVYDVDDGIPENHVSTGNVLEEIGFFIRAMPGNLKKAINKAVSDTNKKITCVTNDAFVWMSGVIAEELGVPWIPIWLAGASSFSCHYYTDLIRCRISGQRNTEPLSCIPGMSLLRACDLPEEISGDINSGFAQMLHMAGLMMPRATAVAANSLEDLEIEIVDHLQSKLKMFLPVAPYFSMSSSSLSDPHKCVSWLDSQEPASVAYISFGTMATPPPEELAALAEGLEASGVPFLWSIKDYAKISLPGGFLDRTTERGKVVPWAPQTKVLQHSAIGVFVTHCGWASVMESIIGGVPIICRPFFADQMMNQKLVSRVWEIGVEVGDGVFTKDETMKALDVVLRREQGKLMKEKVQALKAKAEQAIAPNGSTARNFNSLLEILNSDY